MSYDLAVREGPLPASGADAAIEFEWRMEAAEREQLAAAPIIQQLVSQLTDRRPEDSESSPWSEAPMIDDANGTILYLGLITTLRSIPAQFAWALGRLDGRKNFAYNLWKLPEGKHADDLVRDAHLPDAYLQGAGTAQAMTVDVRMFDERRWQNFTVGRPSTTKKFGRHKTTTIRWLTYSAVVRDNEAFTATQAAAVFQHYFERGTLPSGYELRPVDN